MSKKSFKSGNGSGLSKSKKQSSTPLYSDDDIDAFQAQREKILLDEDDQVHDLDQLDEAVMDLPDDSDESEEDEKWGRNKKTFYSADTATSDLCDEAMEARKLQKKQLGSLKEEDFIKNGNVKVACRSGPISLVLSDDDDDEDDDRFASETELDGMNGDDLENILSEEDKKSINEKHGKETVKFLLEFQRKTTEVREYLEPLLTKMRESKSDKGLGFLETKHQLLIGYCANLAYYLILKVQGRKSIVRHPVIERLVKYRLLLERIKPLEAKLQYQVDKLLHAGSNKSKGINDEEDAALAFRPNLNLLEQVSSDNESEDERNVYKAPKIAPVHFGKGGTDHQEEREKIIASNSRLLADIQADLEDRPEEENVDPAYGRNQVASQSASKHREEYEEDNFIRLSLSKKERSKLEQKRAKPIDELEDLNDFFKNESNGKKSSAIDRLLGTKTVKKSKHIGGDDDVKSQERKRTNSNANARVRINENDGDSDMSEIEDDLADLADQEDDLYKKSKARAANNKKSSTNRQMKVNQYRPIRDSKPGDDRPVTYEMMKNRGLTPNRPKEVRNPRVRQRQKWERAQKKIGSFKQIAKNPSGSYSGESSGIRTNISRSVKF